MLKKLKLENATETKSLVASIGVHGMVVVAFSLFTYITTPRTLELTGGAGNGLGGGGKSISLEGFNLAPKRAASAPKKVVTTTKPDPFAKKVSATKEIITDTVTEQASVVSSDGPIGEATGSGDGSGSGFGGSGLGIGTGAGDFDGGLLFSKIKRYFENRLGSTLTIDEDQLIKVKLKLNAKGEILGAELIEGRLEMINLRKVLSVARNVPLKNYWASSMAFPQELIIPLFLTTNS